MPELSYSYELYEHHQQLSPTIQQLIKAADLASTKAYAPYSGFAVGCAVLLENEKVITGANVENAAYPAGICAERVALAHAMTNYPNIKILILAISYSSPNTKQTEPIYPCGMCRQFIFEC